jgi:GABA permease
VPLWTPARAILLATLAGWISVALAYLAPEAVFSFLLNAAGSVALVIYCAIAVSQIRLRRVIEGEGGPLPVRMWGYPYLSWCTVGLLAVVVAGMLVLPDTRSQLGIGLVAPSCFVVIYLVRRRLRSRRPAPGTAPSVPVRDPSA